jgi:pyruvate dehydrogenase E1 component alpha subunit
MVGDRLEGHDVEVVQERLGAAVARARAGEGPTFVEIQTYRFRGHSMSDPAKYRSRTELEQRKQQDPITVVRERLLGLGVSENALDDIDLEVDAEIDAAVRFADESEPAREDVMMATVLAAEDGS